MSPDKSHDPWLTYESEGWEGRGLTCTASGAKIGVTLPHGQKAGTVFGAAGRSAPTAGKPIGT